VTAAYLAKDNKKVLVLEKRYLVGGAAVTEETFPGFKVSTASYVNSLFRPGIIRDLKLHDYGFEMLERNPSSFTPFPNNTYLFLGPDKEKTYNEIAKFSKKDADAFPKYEEMLERVAEFIEPTIDDEAINPMTKRFGELYKLAKLGLEFRGLGPDMTEAVRILSAPA
jgi:phytoene dehydrogenase-like protein